jgi:hypothetical protein
MATVKEKESAAPVPMYKKLHNAKLAIGKVHKNAQSHHSRYADLNAVLDACENILMENGLIIMQPIIDQMVYTKIIDVDTGEHVESMMKLPDLQNPQQLGSAISYYRRYTLTSILSLAATDDDGKAASKATEDPKPAAKTSLTDEAFGRALAKIARGEYTAQELRTNYLLTKDQEAKL